MRGDYLSSITKVSKLLLESMVQLGTKGKVIDKYHPALNKHDPNQVSLCTTWTIIDQHLQST